VDEADKSRRVTMSETRRWRIDNACTSCHEHLIRASSRSIGIDWDLLVHEQQHEKELYSEWHRACVSSSHRICHVGIESEMLACCAAWPKSWCISRVAVRDVASV